jgi:hypothetical protein
VGVARSGGQGGVAEGHPAQGLGLGAGEDQVSLCAGCCHSCCVLRSLLPVTGAEGEFVVDRGAHVERGVMPVVVLLLDPGCHPRAGLGLGGELPEYAQRTPSWSADDRIVRRRPDPAHRLRDAVPGRRRPQAAGDVLAALIGVKDDGGDGAFAAAYRDRGASVKNWQRTGVPRTAGRRTGD